MVVGRGGLLPGSAEGGLRAQRGVREADAAVPGARLRDGRPRLRQHDSAARLPHQRHHLPAAAGQFICTSFICTLFICAIVAV